MSETPKAMPHTPVAIAITRGRYTIAAPYGLYLITFSSRRRRLGLESFFCWVSGGCFWAGSGGIWLDARWATAPVDTWPSLPDPVICGRLSPGLVAGR